MVLRRLQRAHEGKAFQRTLEGLVSTSTRKYIRQDAGVRLYLRLFQSGTYEFIKQGVPDH